MSTLSVVMTNYNHAEYLDRSLNAICTQSRPPDEFIVQDDCSTDNSMEIIRGYADKYSFIKTIKNKKNMGAMLAAEKVINLATKEWLFCASADDFILPNFFEIATQWIDKYPGAGICTGDIQVHNMQLSKTFTMRLGFADFPAFIQPDFLADCIKGQPIFGHCTIYNREKFFISGGIIKSLSYMSDWFIALVLGFRYGAIYVPQVFCQATTGIKGFADDECSNQRKKHDAISSFLRLVKTKYRDILPHFIRSAALTNYYDEAVKTVTTTEEFWDVESMLLIQYPLLVQQHLIANTIAERQKRSAVSDVNTFCCNDKL